MASTTPTHVDSSIPELWSRKTLRKQLKKGFFARFAGAEGSGSVMIQITELMGGPGDLAHIQVTNPLAGAGVSGDTSVLEGNEENLTTSEIKTSPTLYRHGVRRFRRAQHKSIIDLREESKNRLAEWGAAKMDTIRFNQFVSKLGTDVPDGVYTPNQYSIGGYTAGLDDVLATEKLTVDAIRTVRYKLEDQGAIPVETPEGEVYFFIISPEMEFDLKQDTKYDAAVRDAQLRGSSNPLFTGALAKIDGMVLLPHFRVPTANNAGAVRVAKSIAFGQEAFVECVDEQAHWAERDFDYGNELGVGYGFSFQPRRALEQNSLIVYAASTKPA